MDSNLVSLSYLILEMLFFNKKHVSICVFFSFRTVIAIGFFNHRPRITHYGPVFMSGVPVSFVIRGVDTLEL